MSPCHVDISAKWRGFPQVKDLTPSFANDGVDKFVKYVSMKIMEQINTKHEYIANWINGAIPMDNMDNTVLFFGASNIMACVKLRTS